MASTEVPFLHRAFASLSVPLVLAGCSQFTAPAAARSADRVAGASAVRAGQLRGIGGFFFRSTNPAAQYDWYTRHLGLDAKPDQGTYFFWQLPGNPQSFSTMWFIFPAKTSAQNGVCMLNYVVDDLMALLERLKAEGVRVEPKTQSDEGGKFGWAYDQDGNKLELFEPAIAVTPQPHGHVLGFGGIALKSANAPALAGWYAQHLGISAARPFVWELPGNPPTSCSTSWDVYPTTTDHFNGPCMATYLVDDLPAVLNGLKSEGVQVEASADGRLGWAYDGDGNKFELRDPAKPPAAR